MLSIHYKNRIKACRNRKTPGRMTKINTFTTNDLMQSLKLDHKIESD